MIEQLSLYFSSAATVTAPDSRLSGVSVSTSEPQVDDSGGDIYFTVTVNRDSQRPQQPPPPLLPLPLPLPLPMLVPLLPPQVRQQPSRPDSQPEAACQLDAERAPSVAAIAAAGATGPASAASARKRRTEHRCVAPGSTDAAARAVDSVAARVRGLTSGATAKRARLSASTKPARQPHRSADSHPLSTAAVEPVGGLTVWRRPSMALSASSSASASLSTCRSSSKVVVAAGAASSAASQSSGQSGGKPLLSQPAPGNAYVAMMAELDARVAQAFQVSTVCAARSAATQSTRPSQPTLAARTAHNASHTNKSSTSDHRASAAPCPVYALL